MQKKKAAIPEHIAVPWPETDNLNLRVMQDDEEITLMTYRYPVPEGTARKGIIFYLHGFGSYCERYAYQAQAFAEAGYEVIGMDQRGFGNSGGHRGLFESSDVVYADLYLCVFKTIQQYKVDLQRVPLFLFGKSLGGLLAFNLAIRFPNMFQGISLLVPFFRHYTDVLDKYKWGYKFFNLLQFYTSFSNRNTYRPGFAEYVARYAYYFDDPKLYNQSKVSSVCFFLDEQQWSRENTERQRTPILVINAKEDDVVKNEASIEILKKIKNPQNKVVEIAGADHTTISIELEYSTKTINETVAYFDSLIAPASPY